MAPIKQALLNTVDFTGGNLGESLICNKAQSSAILLHAKSNIIISLWQGTADTKALHGGSVTGTL